VTSGVTVDGFSRNEKIEKEQPKDATTGQYGPNATKMRDFLDFILLVRVVHSLIPGTDTEGCGRQAQEWP
jgi:hypothetical protein